MFGLFGILTTLIGKLPVLGPWIAKLWTETARWLKLRLKQTSKKQRRLRVVASAQSSSFAMLLLSLSHSLCCFSWPA